MDSSVYSFFVSGHWHGSSTSQSGYPAATVLANVDLINKSEAGFIMSTGDLFLDITKNIPNYKKSLFDKLQKPIFNAVGNHDLSAGVYEKQFGSTWYMFKSQNELFIVLNTEKNDGSIKGDQLTFLKETLKKYPLKNIFIFSHRPVWSEGNPDLENIFQENTQSDFGNNFHSEILPLLKKYSSNQHVYWFSGSLGGNAPASFFYYKDENNITYIQSAIRDLPRDGLLKVNVANGKVSFETISLTDQKMPKLEECGLNLWKNPPSESFNYRLVPLYTKQMFFHRYFWYGVGFTLSFVFLFIFIRKRVKHKKSG
ncbi:MAG TPA: metallophosphoesterase [Flavobacteriales bacterium]|nr:metallophosphoesterase [Flavobacteriales bacterium]